MSEERAELQRLHVELQKLAFDPRDWPSRESQCPNAASSSRPKAAVRHETALMERAGSVTDGVARASNEY